MRAAICLLLLLAACAPILAAHSTPQPAPTGPNPAIEIFFTDPAGDGAQTLRGGPDAQLAAAIDNARLSVDMAMHDLNLWSVRDALLAAHERGVEVRLVVESDNLAERSELQELQAAGIPIRGDERQALMHNKFTVIDQHEVWTGSVNLTVSDMYFNRNNVIHISSTELAANYTAEFEEMFTNGLFGDSSPASTGSLMRVNDRPIESFFSPDAGVMGRMVELIGEAEYYVAVLAFSLTSDALAEALLEASERGVVVTVVMDEEQALNNDGGEYERLSGNLPLVLDAEDGNLHHKVIVIDNTIVIAGSYNFSNNAERRNDENTLIIHDAFVAMEYLEENDLIWELTQQ
jgi:phosphatidylserine/phosphatidylglycerophosphate/cardiolipin synthase-like enzyme